MSVAALRGGAGGRLHVADLLRAAAWGILALLAGAVVSRAPTESGLLTAALAVAIAIGAGVVFFVFARPSATFVAAFALLAVVPTNPAPVDIVFVLLIGAAVLPVRIVPHVPPGTALALGGLAAISTLSMLNAQALSRALVFNATTLYLIVLAVWLSAVFVDRDLTRRAVKAYVMAAAVSAAVGAVALNVPFPGHALFLFDPHRAQALFKDPNVFGPFLVPAAAIALEDVVHSRLLRWSPRKTALLYAVIATGVVVSFSRAAWVNLAIATIVVLGIYAARARGKGTFRGILTVALCGVAGFGILATTGQLHFLESRSKLQRYDQSRFATQSKALELATQHVLGHGPGQTEVELPISTHSLYARVSYEQGLGGVALLIAVLVATLGAAVGIAARDVEIHGIGSAALLASWLGLVFNSFFIDTLHWRHLWVVASLIWAASVLSARAASPARSGS
jgi:hypothetical protein